MSFLFLDVESVPINKDDYLKRSEEERLKLLNPIDSKIIAVGVKVNKEKALTFMDESEKVILEGFWGRVKEFKKSHPAGKLVGFNVKSFDLPFLVTRSLVCNVRIIPFNLRDVVDLRELVSAYRFGATRGKLKEFAKFLGLDVIEGMDGGLVAIEYWNNNLDKIRVYLEKDLEITEALHKRIVELDIDKIAKW